MNNKTSKKLVHLLFEEKNVDVLNLLFEEAESPSFTKEMTKGKGTAEKKKLVLTKAKEYNSLAASISSADDVKKKIAFVLAFDICAAGLAQDDQTPLQKAYDTQGETEGKTGKVLNLSRYIKTSGIRNKVSWAKQYEDQIINKDAIKVLAGVAFKIFNSLAVSHKVGGFLLESTDGYHIKSNIKIHRTKYNLTVTKFLSGVKQFITPTQIKFDNLYAFFLENLEVFIKDSGDLGTQSDAGNAGFEKTAQEFLSFLKKNELISLFASKAAANTFTNKLRVDGPSEEIMASFFAGLKPGNLKKVSDDETTLDSLYKLLSGEELAPTDALKDAFSSFKGKSIEEKIDSLLALDSSSQQEEENTKDMSEEALDQLLDQLKSAAPTDGERSPVISLDLFNDDEFDDILELIRDPQTADSFADELSRTTDLSQEESEEVVDTIRSSETPEEVNKTVEEIIANEEEPDKKDSEEETSSEKKKVKIKSLDMEGADSIAPSNDKEILAALIAAECLSINLGARPYNSSSDDETMTSTFTYTNVSVGKNEKIDIQRLFDLFTSQQDAREANNIENFGEFKTKVVDKAKAAFEKASFKLIFEATKNPLTLNLEKLKTKIKEISESFDSETVKVSVLYQKCLDAINELASSPATLDEPKEEKEETKLDRIKPLLKDVEDLTEENYAEHIDYDKIKKAFVQNKDLSIDILGKMFNNKDLVKLKAKKKNEAVIKTIKTLIVANLVAILQQDQGKLGLNENIFRDAMRSARRGVDFIGSLFGLSSNKQVQGVLDNRVTNTAGVGGLTYGLLGTVGKIFGVGILSGPLFAFSAAALASYATWKFVKRCGKNIEREGMIFQRDPAAYVENLTRDGEFESLVSEEVQNIYDNIDDVDIQQGSMRSRNIQGALRFQNRSLQITNTQREEFSQRSEEIQNAIREDYTNTLGLIRNNTNLENLLGRRNLSIILNQVYLQIAQNDNPLNIIQNKNSNARQLYTFIQDACIQYRPNCEGVIEDVITAEIQHFDDEGPRYANIDFTKDVGAADDDDRNEKWSRWGNNGDENNKGLLDTIGGKAQRRQILEFVESVCNQIATQLAGPGFDFERLMNVYGENSAAAEGSTVEEAYMNALLSSKSISLLYENLQEEQEESRRGVASAAASSSAGAIIAGIGFLNIFKNVGDAAAGSDFAQAAAAAVDTPAEALAAANQELDVIHKIVQLKNGNYFITYYTNMDALKGTKEALSGVFVKVNKAGEAIRSQFIAHRPENIVKYVGDDLSRGGVDVKTMLAKGVVELTQNGGATDVTNGGEKIGKVLKFAYESMEGSIKDVALEQLVTDIKNSATEFVKASEAPSRDAATTPPGEYDPQAPSDTGGFDNIEQYRNELIDHYKETRIFKMMDEAKQKDVLAKIDKLIKQEDLALPNPGQSHPDTMPSDEISTRVNLDGSTQPKGNTGLNLAKSKLSLTDIWLASAGLTNLIHNLTTYFTRKRKEPREIAKIFNASFDPTRVVLVGIFASLLGRSLEGTAGSNINNQQFGGDPHETSLIDLGEGVEEASQEPFDANDLVNDLRSSETRVESFIHNIKLKDFLFENKISYKRK